MLQHPLPEQMFSQQSGFMYCKTLKKSFSSVKCCAKRPRLKTDAAATRRSVSGTGAWRSVAESPSLCRRPSPTQQLPQRSAASKSREHDLFTPSLWSGSRAWTSWVVLAQGLSPGCSQDAGRGCAELKVSLELEGVLVIVFPAKKL